jgi:hypothetical protein
MNHGHGEKLTRKQEQAIAALLGQPTIDKAARVVGVTGQTLKNWLKLPEFQQAFQQARQAVLRDALGRLQATSTEAADTLRKLLKAKSETVRLGAARSILELGVKLRESLEYEARIAALEARASQEGRVRR